MLNLHHTLQECIEELHIRFPQTPFLTLGQTVFWDEPLKAAFCRALEEIAPHIPVIGGVHNTDYFAKLPNMSNGESPFLLLPHNDGNTRDLWSAAGEISCLFGSETIPTRQKYTANGVAFDRLARNAAEGADNFLNEQTSAWGWRALVQTDNQSHVADDIQLRDIYPALREQLRWAFSESLEILGQSKNDVTQQMLGWLDDFYAARPDANLTQTYQFFIPRIWALVRGRAACPLETSSTTELLRFNKSTFARPVFALLELFLNPTTRAAACQCYNNAVRDSGIYQLEQFGEGALPFDIVIPGQGRGTLRLDKNNVIIETEKPQILCNDCHVGTAQQLAELLEDSFGENVTLVGKAVTLISMLSAEFIFVFHEKASSYTALTQKMNQQMRAAGMTLDLHPMLRLRHATWDALSAVNIDFNLPEHLAESFGVSRIHAADFGAKWRDVCDEQDRVIKQLAQFRAPRDLLAWLAEKDEKWQEKVLLYDQLRDAMSTLLQRIKIKRNGAANERENADQAITRSVELEQLRGDYWRTHLLPLKRQMEDIHAAIFARQKEQATRKMTKEERATEKELRQQEKEQLNALKSTFEERNVRRQDLAAQIEALRVVAREHRAKASALIQEQVALEKSEEMCRLRESLRDLENEVGREHLRRVKNAILTNEGLRYTNYRPTAWWLPLVSPDNKWFEALVTSAQARIEEL